MPKSAKILQKGESRVRIEKIVSFLRLQTQEYENGKPVISLSVYIEEITKATALHRITDLELKQAAHACKLKKLVATAYPANAFTEVSNSAFVVFTPRIPKPRMPKYFR